MGSVPFMALSAENRVEGWAAAPLPFEPKGWMLQYRQALRATIAELPTAPGRALVGCYATADARRCDVENLLLYNVGLAAFARLQVHDVILMRATMPPPPPEVMSKALGHYHRYELVDAPPQLPSGRTVAHLAPMPVRMSLRVESLWYDIRSRGRLDVCHGAGLPLAVEVTVHRPPAVSRPWLLSMVKVLVDGFISALHTHDGTHLPVVAERLGARLNVPADRVAELLSVNAADLLGLRRLLWPFRDFVQWNPADDIIRWLRVRTQASSTWQLSATVSTVERWPES